MSKKTVIFIVQTLIFILLSLLCWYYYAAEYGRTPNWTMTEVFKTVAFIINFPMWLIVIVTGYSIYAFPILGPIINGLLVSLIVTGTIKLIRTMKKKRVVTTVTVEQPNKITDTSAK